MPFPITLANTSLCLLLLAGAGCRSIGPSTVKRDRLHYSSAVGDSCKEQLLLNIVKTRYGDSPAFLQVSSLVAGYTLETGLGAHGQYSPASLRGDTFMGGEISGKFTDRPTISYMPLTGEKFTRTLMSPVPLEFLWSVIQGGSPVDFLLGLTLPLAGIIIPLYYVVRGMGFYDTKLAIILPLIGLYMPFGVFWMRAHFLGMPAELSEAARVDGATTRDLFWRIHVPLARPALLPRRAG